MKYKAFLFALFSLLFSTTSLMAQKPFVEGSIVYNLEVQIPDEHGNMQMSNGTYIVTIKGKQIRKELKMRNGYDDIIIFNTSTNTVYSLKASGDKKFAIQLSMADFVNRSKEYENYKLTQGDKTESSLAGVVAQKGNITYKNGNVNVIFFSKEWKPEYALTFERFPDCDFLPLDFNYKIEDGSLLHFVAQKVAASPVENSIFRIPADYKIISYTEYKQLSK